MTGLLFSIDVRHLRRLCGPRHRYTNVNFEFGNAGRVCRDDAARCCTSRIDTWTRRGMMAGNCKYLRPLMTGSIGYRRGT